MMTDDEKLEKLIARAKLWNDGVPPGIKVRVGSLVTDLCDALAEELNRRRDNAVSIRRVGNTMQGRGDPNGTVYGWAGAVYFDADANEEWWKPSNEPVLYGWERVPKCG